jgi:N-acetylglutamate synthase-like GNAT family acetyltransferase
MGMLKVREATVDDADAITKLYSSLVSDPNILVTGSRLREIGSNPHNFVFVGESDQEVCATAFLTLCMDPMYENQPYALVENVVVLESRRGQSFGKQLMEFVEDFCRQRRCTKIMLLSSSHRKNAHAFFERMGYDGRKKVGFVNYINRPKS